MRPFFDRVLIISLCLFDRTVKLSALDQVHAQNIFPWNYSKTTLDGFLPPRRVPPPKTFMKARAGVGALKKGTASSGPFAPGGAQPRDTSARSGAWRAGNCAAAPLSGRRSVSTDFRRPAKAVYSARVMMKRVRADTC